MASWSRELSLWSLTLPPPPGLSLPDERALLPSVSPRIPEDHGAYSESPLREPVLRQPPALPKGDNRFHPFQRLKPGEWYYGCRVCVCDRCHWQAFFHSKAMPWQGAFVHEESLRRFFDQAGGRYNINTIREYYERGWIDATWYCIWCLADARERSPEQICEDYKLYSQNAISRVRAWCS